MASLNFDANEVEPQGVFEAIPADWYVTQITDSEMKPTSSGNGNYLQLEHTIMDGEFNGRKLFDRLNMDNPNPVAVEIAQKTLSAICHAVGVMQVGDSQQLHGQPMMTKVVVKQAETGADGNQYEARNEIKGYKACDGGGSSVPSTGGGDGAPSWAKKKEEPAAEAPVKKAPLKKEVPPEEMPLEMTDKAGGATLESFYENEWTDEEIIADGYAVRKEPPKKVAPKAPPKKKAPPAADSEPETEAEAGKKPPPWAKK